MMHQQIEDEEVIERYVRNLLAPTEREAFEQHFFSCQDCFDRLQTTERFVAGMRDAARRGTLGDNVRRLTPARHVASRWFPAFGLSACAVLILAFLAGWQYFVQLPRLRQELSRTTAEARAQEQAHSAAEQQLARAAPPEINVPLVILQTTRDLQATSNEVMIPPGASHLVLWIEVPPGSAKLFHLQVDTMNGHAVETVDNLQRNPYGALAVSFPAEALQSGEYRIKLSRQEPPGSLLGEYRLKIRKP
jgi:hypothetical protein